MMVTKFVRIAGVLVATCVLLLAIDVVGNLNVTGTLTAAVVNFASAQSTVPMKTGTALPQSCSVGEAFFKTDAAAGSNIYLCTATNTWTQVLSGSSGGGGGGGGSTPPPDSFDWKPSSRYVVYRSEMGAFYNQTTPAYLGDIMLIRSTGTTNLNVPSPSIPFLHPGLAAVSTSATSGNRVAWHAQLGGAFASDTESYFANTNKPWEFEVIFRSPAASDYSNASFWIGLMAATAENPPRGVVVRYLNGTDTNYTIAYAGQNTWGDTVDTGVAPSTDWHRLRIRSDGSVANKIWIRLDNGPEYSGCPSGCDLDVATYLSSTWSGTFRVDITTHEAVAKTLVVDYIHFWLDYGAVR